MWWLTVKVERVHHYPDIPLHPNWLAVWSFSLIGIIHSQNPKTAGFANRWKWLALDVINCRHRIQSKTPTHKKTKFGIKTSLAVTQSGIVFIVLHEVIKNVPVLALKEKKKKLRQNPLQKMTNAYNRRDHQSLCWRFVGFWFPHRWA